MQIHWAANHGLQRTASLRSLRCPAADQAEAQSHEATLVDLAALDRDLLAAACIYLVAWRFTNGFPPSGV